MRVGSRSLGANRERIESGKGDRLMREEAVKMVKMARMASQGVIG